jgi:hypothetical protein
VIYVRFWSKCKKIIEHQNQLGKDCPYGVVVIFSDAWNIGLTESGRDYDCLSSQEISARDIGSFYEKRGGRNGILQKIQNWKHIYLLLHNKWLVKMKCRTKIDLKKALEILIRNWLTARNYHSIEFEIKKIIFYGKDYFLNVNLLPRPQILEGG